MLEEAFADNLLQLLHDDEAYLKRGIEVSNFTNKSIIIKLQCRKFLDLW